MLNEIEGLKFFEDIHRYSLHDTWLLHSVTGVLSFDMSPFVQARINATRDGEKGWARRGTTVHAALEHHLLGEAQVNPGQYEEWINPLLNNWLVQDTKPIAVEYRLCDPRISLAGSFDFLIEYKGKTILGDLKTVGSAKAVEARKAATAQLGGYLNMLNYHHPKLWIDKCVTLVSGPGAAKVISSEPDECINAWEDAWGRYSVHLEVKEPF
tara:strand:- start:228 stop:860 length:633 start_codon:yes stop_codon:yes gene_type:complete